ncbi:hypothetical protein F5877DRAFT_85312 [Lentinula edodes]|nr:hypothetical protein F5877DRAFT_85312 [Lentinula edodes]
MPIKGGESDIPTSNMPPTPPSLLVPCIFTAHPYRAENQHLAAQVWLLESQLVKSQRKNSALTTALRNTSQALEARQWEVEQLRTSSREVLSGPPGQSLLEHFQKVEEELRVAKKDWDAATGKLSTSSRKVSELTTALLHKQGVADKVNALATRQRLHMEELQEEVHRTRGCTFCRVDGDLIKVWADLCCVAALAHCLHRSDPATVLHHHNHYIGAIIETVIAFLHHGLDSDDPNIVAHNFCPSAHSRFDSDGPFLTAAQHAGSVTPPPNLLEPPLHCHMLALLMALPHCEGAGWWDNIVPAIPGDDQLMLDWEQLMLQYIHHITDTPLSAPDMPVPILLVEPGVEVPGEVGVEQSFEVGVS